jgi:hypothetical protein
MDIAYSGGYTFDIEQWESRFPLEWADLQSGLSSQITSPSDLVFIEQIRKRIARTCDLGPTVPTDVFVFAVGAAPQRAATKVGGLPYRPDDLPWPMGADDQPMLFLAQFCFAESRDLVGPLPGDVLVVFATDLNIYRDRAQEYLHFEWHPLGIERPAQWIEQKFGWDFVTCYGYRHRTVDYVEPIPAEAIASADLGYPISHHEAQTTAHTLSRIEGMKIGGLPAAFFGDDEPSAPGRFLCSLATIYPSFQRDWPWVNVEEPLGQLPSEESHLNIGDGFILNFFLDETQKVRWTVRTA